MTIFGTTMKCIQISTNMPVIGSSIREIAITISEMSTNLLTKINTRMVSVSEVLTLRMRALVFTEKKKEILTYISRIN